MLTVQELAQRLIRDELRAGAGNPTAAAIAACENLFAALSIWVGSTGADALLKRALVKAKSEHSGLAGIHVRGDAHPYLTGVDNAINEKGTEAVEAGLRAMLVTSLEVLGRLIGEDIVAQILEGGTGK